MILPDTPIENKENDQLKRTPLAIKVADLVHKYEGKQSFVIGIEGVWGSGKTSFVNLVLHELLQKENVIVVNFNPWNFTGQNELIADFFSSVFASIKKETGKDFIKTLRSYASKLKVSFSPSINIPIVGSVGTGEIWHSGSKTLQEERVDIDAKLRTLNKKIVVVIDDIDRLDKVETRLIMKLVKMTANFSNTIFLLAYDRNRVAERLCEDGWPGEEYLKKIIQVSFTLPEPDNQGLRKILFNDLDVTIQGVYGEAKLEGEDEKRWHEMLYAGLGDLFKTIRDIKRYVSSLRLNWSIMGKDDINMVDFIAIEAIRVFAPRFYSAISSNRSLFTGISSLYAGFNSRDDEAAKEARYKELIQEIPKEIVEPISKICKVLFPQLDFRSHYGHDWEPTWRTERRICADERFGFYFQLGIPEGAISESEVANLIKTLDNEKNFSDNIIRFNGEKRLRPMLSKILDRVDKLTEEQAKIMILSIWNLEKQIDDEGTAMFDFDEVGIQTNRLAYQSLLKIVTKEKRSDFVKSLIENTKNVYYPTRFLAMLEDGNKKKAEQIDGSLLTDEEIVAIKPILVKKINDLAIAGSLSKEDRFVFLLFIWKEWEGEEKVKKYIEGIVKERAGLLDFIRGFVSKVLSTAGDYKKLEKKSISQLYPLETIEELVKQITNDEINKMVEKDKEAINLFRNPPKNEW
ncbi:MAG: P-loop NTPase fold protein [Patescibacteria group bacterium]|nr:P-loop NTPase fold protein [Patescibacteria group bacterium]